MEISSLINLFFYFINNLQKLTKKTKFPAIKTGHVKNCTPRQTKIATENTEITENSLLNSFTYFHDRRKMPVVEKLKYIYTSFKMLL